MKKLFFFFLLLFSIPIYVFAEDLALEDLKITNGKLSIPFDSLNNEYTILLDQDIYHVDFEYKVPDGITVVESNNQDLQNNAVVTITLEKAKESVEYHFQILKEEEEIQEVFLEKPEPVEMNIMTEYKNYIIPFGCFVLITIVFQILFHKKRKHKR